MYHCNAKLNRYRSTELISWQQANSTTNCNCHTFHHHSLAALFWHPILNDHTVYIRLTVVPRILQTCSIPDSNKSKAWQQQNPNTAKVSKSVFPQSHDCRRILGQPVPMELEIHNWLFRLMMILSNHDNTKTNRIKHIPHKKCEVKSAQFCPSNQSRKSCETQWTSTLSPSQLLTNA